jgi:hypothetical protein
VKDVLQTASPVVSIGLLMMLVILGFVYHAIRSTEEVSRVRKSKKVSSYGDVIYNYIIAELRASRISGLETWVVKTENDILSSVTIGIQDDAGGRGIVYEVCIRELHAFSDSADDQYESDGHIVFMDWTRQKRFKLKRRLFFMEVPLNDLGWLAVRRELRIALGREAFVA